MLKKILHRMFLSLRNSILERTRDTEREMGCNTLALISPVATGTSNITHGLHQSKSSKNLGRETTLRRCFSENHISNNKSSSISASSTKPELKPSKSTGALLPFQLSSSILPSSIQSFLFDSETSNNMNLVEEKENNSANSDEVGTQEEKMKRSNWIEKLLEIRCHWMKRRILKRTEEDDELEKDEIGGCGDDGGCEVSYSSDEDEEKQESEVNYDRDTFSKLLVQVSPQETRLFSQLAFLCNIAYVIPTIKPKELWDMFRLELVTSSIDKKAEAAAIKEKFEQDSTCVPIAAYAEPTNSHHGRVLNSNETCSPSVAYGIAVTAATYVQQHTKDLQSFDLEAQEEGFGDGEQIQEEERNPHRRYKSDVSAYDMATSTMIAVVAAGEKEKQEAAQDLQSPHSSPCDWFICDDLNVRYFVIQGSDSSASWQANLLFEPTEFEGTDGIVHRGIYEAAKGIYEQFLPEVMIHLEKYGPDAKFQFTGHSLGGSLALLVTLMLLKRKVLKPSNLQPVVTFGSPFVFCGGHKILKQLGVDDNLVRSVIMHRDIVPRAFACSYPNQIAMLLKRLNTSFRSHPCLIRKKLLYSPVGKVFILQPDEKTSPYHPLLPAGNALYELDKTRCGYSMSALRSFLNRPHPIVTLSNPRAYGSDGTILRDHDSSNYLKAVNGVLRQQMKAAGLGRITGRNQGNELWPLLTSPSLHSWSHRSNLSVNKEVLTGV